MVQRIIVLNSSKHGNTVATRGGGTVAGTVAGTDRIVEDIGGIFVLFAM